jgi:hypothetical protein
MFDKLVQLRQMLLTSAFGSLPVRDYEGEREDRRNNGLFNFYNFR